MPAGDKLDLHQMRRALVGTRFAAHLHHFPTIDSTSTALLAEASAGAPEGTVYLADEQTAGRGRGGHDWHSAPGDGLYLSALIAPPLVLADALLLSLATGLAVQRAVREQTGLALDLRWPNDLLVQATADKAVRKCGGILVETAVGAAPAAQLRHAVVGIGLNLHHRAFPPELARIATSLALANGAHPERMDRAALAVSILRAFDFELDALERDPSATHAELRERFSAASSWVRGKRVQVPEQGGYTGITSGLDSRGFLLVQTDSGEQRTVLSGGVREVDPHTLHTA